VPSSISDTSTIHHTRQDSSMMGATGETFDQEIVSATSMDDEACTTLCGQDFTRAQSAYSLVTQNRSEAKPSIRRPALRELTVWAWESLRRGIRRLQELPVQIDDVQDRTRIYSPLLKGENTLEPARRNRFNV